MPKTKNAFAMRDFEEIGSDFFQNVISADEFCGLDCEITWQKMILDHFIRSKETKIGNQNHIFYFRPPQFENIPRDNVRNEVAEIQLYRFFSFEQNQQVILQQKHRISRHLKRLQRFRASSKQNAYRLLVLKEKYRVFLENLVNYSESLDINKPLLLKMISKSYRRKFGQNLRELRIKNGLTQVEVAKLLGIAQITYSTYERGLNEPNLFSIYALSKILKTPINKLLGDII